MNIHEYLMDSHGYQRMDIHGYSWIFMDIHGYQRMDIHEYSWIFMVFHGYSWFFMGFHFGFVCQNEKP